MHARTHARSVSAPGSQPWRHAYDWQLNTAAEIGFSERVKNKAIFIFLFFFSVFIIIIIIIFYSATQWNGFWVVFFSTAGAFLLLSLSSSVIFAALMTFNNRVKCTLPAIVPWRPRWWLWGEHHDARGPLSSAARNPLPAMKTHLSERFQTVTGGEFGFYSSQLYFCYDFGCCARNSAPPHKHRKAFQFG